MRSLEGFRSAPTSSALTGWLLIALSLAGGCGGPIASPYAFRSDASHAGDAGPGWPIAAEVESATLEQPGTLEARHARLVDGAPPIGLEPPMDVPSDQPLAPTDDAVTCVVTADCDTGRCVRGLCSAGRVGDPCDAREDCDASRHSFCNPRTHRCGDFCVDPLACR